MQFGVRLFFSACFIRFFTSPLWLFVGTIPTCILRPALGPKSPNASLSHRHKTYENCINGLRNGRLKKKHDETGVESKWKNSQHNLENFQRENDQDQKWSNTSKLTLLSPSLAPQIDVVVDGHFPKARDVANLNGHFPRDVAKLSDATGWQCLSHLFSKVCMNPQLQLSFFCLGRTKL